MARGYSRPAGRLSAGEGERRLRSQAARASSSSSPLARARTIWIASDARVRRETMQMTDKASQYRYVGTELASH